MTTKKPRTALAKLLDNLKQVDDPVWPTESVELVETPELVFTSVNAQLKREPEQPSDLSLIWIDPEQCRPWRFADRPDDEMGDLQQLAESIAQHGQQEPILVRPLLGDQHCDYEIIFGNRRWRACQHAKIKLLAQVRQLTDQQAALCQKEENEQREDLSDYAKAKSYQRQLENGIFTSEADLSKGLNISRKTLNDIMAFVRVPKELRLAIPDYKHISRALAVKLAALSREKTDYIKLLKLAPRIGKQINTSNIEKWLAGAKTANTAVASVNVLDNKGQPMFQMLEQVRGGLMLKIHKRYASRCSIQELQTWLTDYLSEEQPTGRIHEHQTE
jgi:ParB family chromosome partitioning protein